MFKTVADQAANVNFDDDYNALIKHVSKDIVARAKVSTLISEELRAFDVKFCKRVVTRWNSVLFMLRSVQKITQEQMESIREKMRKRAQTLKKKEVVKKFCLTEIDRAVIDELVDLLEIFDWVTDEFQGDGVTVSRVIPCVKKLQQTLCKNIDAYKYRLVSLLLTVNIAVSDRQISKCQILLFATYEPI